MNRPIVAGGLVGAALALAIWPAARGALDRYDAARLVAAEERAATVSADALPDAPFRLSAGSAARAREIVAARVRKEAGAGGVLVERLAAAAAIGPGIARIAVGLSGAEKAVLTLADTIERDSPGVRFHRWRLEGAAGGTTRLTGELAVAWK